MTSSSISLQNTNGDLQQRTQRKGLQCIIRKCPNTLNNKILLLYSTISCIVEFQYKRPHPLTCSGSQTLVDWRPDLGPGRCTRQGSVVSHDASLSGAPSVGGAS